MTRRFRIAEIYKITYPNGKIYIGQDRTHDINYFGSADSATIAADFSTMERTDFTVRKEIIAVLHDVTIATINIYEQKFIREYRSNDPAIGYNRTKDQKRIIARETVYEDREDERYRRH